MNLGYNIFELLGKPGFFSTLIEPNEDPAKPLLLSLGPNNRNSALETPMEFADINTINTGAGTLNPSTMGITLLVPPGVGAAIVTSCVPGAPIVSAVTVPINPASGSMGTFSRIGMMRNSMSRVMDLNNHAFISPPVFGPYSYDTSPSFIEGTFAYVIPPSPISRLVGIVVALASSVGGLNYLSRGQVALVLSPGGTPASAFPALAPGYNGAMGSLTTAGNGLTMPPVPVGNFTRSYAELTAQLIALPALMRTGFGVRLNVAYAGFSGTAGVSVSALATPASLITGTLMLPESTPIPVSVGSLYTPV